MYHTLLLLLTLLFTSEARSQACGPQSNFASIEALNLVVKDISQNLNGCAQSSEDVKKLAALYKISYLGLIQQLKANPALSKALIEFDKTMKTYIENETDTWSAFWDFRNKRKGKSNQNYDNLLAAKKNLTLALKTSAYPRDFQLHVMDNLTLAMISGMQTVANKNRQIESRAAMGQVVASGVLAADLIVASVLTAGLTSKFAVGATIYTGSATAGLLAATATSTVAAAAGTAGAVTIFELGKMGGYAAVIDNTDYFCNLANEVALKGPKALDNAIEAAKKAAYLTAGFGVFSSAPVLVTTVKATLAVGASSYAVYSLIEKNSQTYRLLDAANEAAKSGDFSKSQQLLNEAQRNSVDVVADSIAGLITILKTRKDLKKADQEIEYKMELNRAVSQMKSNTQTK